jgi:hypothetical protein
LDNLSETELWDSFFSLPSQIKQYAEVGGGIQFGYAALAKPIG